MSLKLLVSTVGHSSHEFASQFGLAILIGEKHSKKLLRKPSWPRKCVVEWTSNAGNCGHGWLSHRPFRPVSRIEFIHKSSLYWPIIGLGTRTWSVAMRCRDPAGQSEFFVRVLRLKTFNWMYCYRELIIVGIVVSTIAVFRLVDNILSSSLHC